MNNLDGLKVGGVFTWEHIRDGKTIGKGEMSNIVTNEGLTYLINSALGAIVGGAPTPFTAMYVGLTTANRSFVAGDTGATINATGQEFEIYDEAARPSWDVQALATTGSILVNNTGAEATFTVGDLSGSGGSQIIYGAFITSSSTKSGSGDASSTLLCGKNFASTRTLFTSDVFKVGYSFSNENKV